TRNHGWPASRRMNVWPTAPVAPSTATGRRASVIGAHPAVRDERSVARSWASCEQRPDEANVAIHARAKLFLLDELLRGVRDVDRARPEQQRLAPVREQRDVGGVGHRR